MYYLYAFHTHTIQVIDWCLWRRDPHGWRAASLNRRLSLSLFASSFIFSFVVVYPLLPRVHRLSVITSRWGLRLKAIYEC